jgi:glycosyltransferase involved in cell wall biosynthesis
LTHYFPGHRGGVEVSAGRVAGKLAERGYEITWIASGTDAPPQDMPGVRFIPVPANNFAEGKFGVPYPLWSRAALGQVREALGSCDVLHIHESLYQGTSAAAKMAQKMKVPYIVTQHIGFIPYKNPLLRFTLQNANKRVALPTLQGARAVAFMSEITQSYFAGLGFRHPASELIPFGVNTEVFNPDAPADRASLGFTDDRPLCLFVGRFVEKKGLPIIGRLATSDANVQWALAGWGPFDPDDWELPNMKVFSDLSGPTLVPLYRAADLFVLPSVGEGYPAVVQEAMACGTPVLISTETAEGYSPAKPLVNMVPADNPHQWERSMKQLLWDRQVLKASSGTLAEFARKHWSWDTCADRYEDLLQRAVAG